VVTPTDIAVKTGTVEVADGVTIYYEEAGSGEPAILLIHGMGGDHTRLRHQFAHLAPDHRVVAIDMRGHGRSDKPEGDYGIEVLTADLLAVIAALQMGRPVLVGHSLGGSVSLYLSVQRPDAVSGIALLDSGLRRNSDKSAELGPFYEKLGGPDHYTRVREFAMGRLIQPGDDPAIAAEVVATNMAVPPHAFLALGRGVLAFDGAEAALACTLPAMIVQSKKPFVSEGVLESLGPNWMIGRAVDAGHQLQLLVPEQVNPMLDRYLLQFA
jgi:pimeloyl-ACP methyl ester carboxylesterase